MSARAILPILILGLGLPVLIFYSIFFGGPSPKMVPIPNFQKYQLAISQLQNDHYQVLGVFDEGASIRVNVWLRSSNHSVSESHLKAIDTLYDLQAIVGKDLSLSVWLYSSSRPIKSELKGLAFYHAQTGRTIFKSPDQLP